MSSNAENALAVLQEQIGKEEGPTDWLEITQEQVNQFADATHDHQFIHVDPERAKDTPFGGAVAHGFLTLSLTAGMQMGMGGDVRHAQGMVMAVNYGLNKVRFINPVRVGKRIRLTRTLAGAELVANGTAVQTTHNVTIHIEGEEKPACVCESLTRFVYA